MLLLLVTSVLKQSVLRGAGAFASRTTIIRQPHIGRKSFSWLLSDQVNGENQREQEEQGGRNKRPETGWNHNVPSESSSFWNGPNQAAQSSSNRRQQERQQSSSSSSSTELRTGWLHNTQSPSSSKQREATEGKKNSSTTNMARRRLELAQLQQERNHRILAPPTFHACGEDLVVAVTEHLISVPVVYPRHSSDSTTTTSTTATRIDVYFSIVEKVDSDATRLFLQNELGSSSLLTPRQRADRYLEFASLDNADDMVLYLQGGPGFGAPTPAVGLALGKGSGSWAEAALFGGSYQRIVLMDQRGTGKSTPITKQTLERQFPDLFLLDQSNDMENNSRSLEEFAESSPEAYSKVETAVTAATQYLAQFRADNIVQDAEYIRKALMKPARLEEDDENVDASDLAPRPWGCSLGQSFGGFCSMTYLSTVPNPPRIMLLTGGIAPQLSNVYEVYGVLWDRVKERSLRYYEMYPGDIALVNTIVQRLLEQPAALPSGGRLTARRFLSLGMALGGSPSAFASFHEILSSAFVGGSLAALANAESSFDSELEFTRAFLKQIDTQQSFDDHPIYFWMHESIYADGAEHSPTQWAAHRAYENKLREAPEFDYRQTSQSRDEPTLFFGEHVFPWMPEDFAELSGVGLRAVANALAAKTDWTPLYDAEHMKLVLEDGKTRCAAAVYVEDMYVDYDACKKVTARDGPLGKCKLYVTNEYQHSGLRDNGGAIFSKLHGMATGGTRTPS